MNRNNLFLILNIPLFRKRHPLASGFRISKQYGWIRITEYRWIILATSIVKELFT